MQAFPSTLIDAKGDLLAGTADNALERLPVGGDGQIIYASSVTSPQGLRWRDPAEGIDAVARNGDLNGVLAGVGLQSSLDLAGLSTADGVTTRVILRPGIVITDAQIVVPTKVTLEAKGRGTILRQSAIFPTNTPLVRLGRASDGFAFNCWLRNIFIDCNGGTDSIGVFSDTINEQSGCVGVLVSKFKKRGIQVLVANGAQHYILDGIEVTFSDAANSGAVAIESEGARYINDVTVNTGGAGPTTTGIGIQVKQNRGTSVDNIHIEKVTTGISIETPCKVDGVNGHSTVTTCVDIASATGGSAIAVFNVRKDGATNAIVDNSEGITLTDASVGYYIRGNGTTGQSKVVSDVASLAQYIDPGTVSLPGFAFRNDRDTGLHRNNTNEITLVIGGVSGIRAVEAGDGEVAMLVRRNVGGSFSLQRVSMGAMDSGGAGFKLLRVPN
jgi:hypothetical protein